MVSLALQRPSGTNPLSLFDTFSIVSLGDDPMRDIYIIPFSNRVLERYKNLIGKIRNVLIEMIENRIASIQRNHLPVFPRTYPQEFSGSKELKHLESEIEKYYNKNPFVFLPHTANYQIDFEKIKPQMRWYFQSYLEM